ncbi:MAG: PAS domain S-box protein [Planctomycetales bacterium]|nr:PAS domain S-box protein [Planctomycetales bacterium]
MSNFKEAKPSAKTDRNSTPSGPKHVIGIGASAGGLEALESLFDGIPPDTGLAFVVVQHLSPDFKSMMDELLSRHTSMAIHRVDDGMQVEPNCVYLIPPKKEMIISDGRLLLTDKDPGDGLSLPIDTFFRSLAQDCEESAIAVVLSGTGTDGSRGIRDVNDAGGLVVVQTIDSAQFDGMPRSAIDTGCAELVLPPKEIGPAIVRYASGEDASAVSVVSDDHIDPMLRIFDLLRERYSLDFASYKTNTVSRRIHRRLQLMRDETLQSYVDRLTSDEKELEALYRDLLIGVTQFFRDTEAFESLASRVVGAVFERHPDQDEVRCWVAACATGEEAYTTAMLLDEEAERRNWRGSVKVFATDVHRASIEFASTGVYSLDRLQGVSEERHKKYFTQHGDKLQVAARLRQMVVFAHHNVLRDAPFTRLELVTCRNMLIYLRPEAQKKVLSLFHFGLRSGGVLMLGSSETPGELSDEFQSIDSKHKIYRKRRDISLLADVHLSPSASFGVESRGSRSRERTSKPRLVERQVVAAYEHLSRSRLSPAFVVSAQGDLIYVTPGGSRYLKPTEGFLQTSFFDLVDGDLSSAMAGLTQRALREQQTVAFSGVGVGSADGKQAVDVSVTPVSLPDMDSQVLIITIDPVQPSHSASRSGSVAVHEIASERIDTLESELRYTRENLQATIQELATSNEELQAANEELVASNEELQSTNEELHSVNEELHTVNAEHQRKIGELTELTEDMENLLQSSDAMTLFLDEQLCIRRFHPGIEKVIQIVTADIGRPLETFTTTLEYSVLIDDLRQVGKTQRHIEKEVRDASGVHYLVRISPYQSRVGSKGVVLSLVDLSALRMTRERLQESERLFRSMFENSAVGIARVGLDGAWLNVNQRLCDIFGYTREELLRIKFQDITHPDDLQADVDDLNRMIRGDIDRYSMQKRYFRKDRSEVWANLTVTLQRDDKGMPLYCISVVQDITPRKQFEAQLEQAIKQRDQFLATLSHELRNPLAALLHAARLIDRRSRGTRKDRPLDVILRQSQQMSNLLDDLLDVSRVTQNKFVLDRQPVDLVQLAREAFEAIQPQMEARDHRTSVDLPDESIWVDADSTRILQAIENLLSNAAKYTNKGGNISLEVTRQQRQAVVRVSDDGIGLRPAMLERVFEMFVQSETSGKPTREGGMGLGLTLTKSIVELHDGEVLAFSEGLDQGSTFEIRLPVTKKRPKQVDEHSDLREKLRSVVLVEDEDDAREMLAETLRLDGFKVVAAEDGDQGLAAILRERPDVALVDVALPGLSGYEVASQVRKTLSKDETKLVAMTGYGRESDRKRSQEAGFDEHLVKPARPEDLQRILSRETPTKPR